MLLIVIPDADDPGTEGPAFAPHRAAGAETRLSDARTIADELPAVVLIPPECIDIPAQMARCRSPCATRFPHTVDRFGVRPGNGRTILACAVWADRPGGLDRGMTQLDSDAFRAISGAIGKPVRVRWPEGNGEAPSTARARLP